MDPETERILTYCRNHKEALIVVILIVAIAAYLIFLRPNPIIGTWTATIGPETITFDFRDDHTCRLFIEGQASITGTYQVTGNEISLTSPDPYDKETVSLKYTLSGDELTVEFPTSFQATSAVVKLHRVGK